MDHMINTHTINIYDIEGDAVIETFHIFEDRIRELESTIKTVIELGGAPAFQLPEIKAFLQKQLPPANPLPKVTDSQLKALEIARKADQDRHGYHLHGSNKTCAFRDYGSTMMAYFIHRGTAKALRRKGWLEAKDGYYKITDAGKAVLEANPR
jgi:hypothetical protein